MSEQVSINHELNWRKGGIIAAGIDSGAATSKIVILVDGRPYAIAQTKTQTPQESASKLWDETLEKSGLKAENVSYVVATGRGRSRIPFAQNMLTEIACAAAGAVRIFGSSVRTVLDAGGQSCRVIHCTERGKATSFLWNDKCAAGIGRSIEVFADMAKKDLNEVGNIALNSENFAKLGDFCAVYAQSEALDLLRSNVPLNEVLAGYHYAMAKRISTFVARSGMQKDFVIIGGLTKNPGIINWIESNLKVKALTTPPDHDPSTVVALGAAIFADSFCRR
jgi:benzoyl-CoA reductase subunit A